MMVIPSSDLWPGGVETLGKCPICGCLERSILYDEMRDCVFSVAPGIWTTWRCGGCRSAYLDPRPDKESIGDAYSTYYTHQAAPNVTPLSLIQTVRSSIGNAYRWTRYGVDSRPRLPFVGWILDFFPAQKRSIDFQNRLIPRPGQLRQRLLDIGCGGGDFLSEVRSSRRDACGVEPDPIARRLARDRGFDVRGSISEWTDDDPFDVITANHVIEHMHEPLADMRAAASLLRKGGAIYIETPNIDALGHDQFGRCWRDLDVPRHLIIFNQSSLEDLLIQAGFADVRFHPRTEIYQIVARQSSRIAEGLDPFGSQVSTAEQLQSFSAPPALSADKVEFLTVTARKA